MIINDINDCILIIYNCHIILIITGNYSATCALACIRNVQVAQTQRKVIDGYTLRRLLTFYLYPLH